MTITPSRDLSPKLFFHNVKGMKFNCCGNSVTVLNLFKSIKFWVAAIQPNSVSYL